MLRPQSSHSLWRRLLIVLTVMPAFSNAYGALSDQTLRVLPDAGSDFEIKDGALLSPILRPRVPGTPGSTAVLNHFVSFFRETLPEWSLEFQNSTSKTPATGDRDVPFVNLIARRDPPWTQSGDVGRLNLVAHYDSKLTPTGFIGATDSAAPCAMIMHVARSVDKALSEKWASMEAEGAADDLDGAQGLQILLLDGEEAFREWTHEDSIYGARQVSLHLALASEWEQTYHPALSTYKTPLSSINLFLLLDLLGGPAPKVPSYFLTTHWAYKSLARLENRLRSLSLFHSSPNHPSKGRKNIPSASTETPDASRKLSAREPVFLPDSAKESFYRFGLIEDDHIPFLARGVEILHMIPTPFPVVWHHMEDDGEHLDLDVVRDWALLFTAFVGEWMELEGFIDEDAKAGTPRAHKAKPRRAWNDVTISKTEL
ncbi:MAG: hypothetical protein M4579_000170 [Chaenotheca gracillima]|nr:MAG: hypothetical protein M4579_000170 [Chaenotheca gracillima]